MTYKKIAYQMISYLMISKLNKNTTEPVGIRLNIQSELLDQINQAPVVNQIVNNSGPNHMIYAPINYCSACAILLRA